MVDVTSATSAPTTSLASKTDKAKASLGADYDSFLKLLTTQLKNQDPTAPMDANQFTEQMVSFTGVEQAINTNTNLEKLISMNSSSQMNDAVAYIGKEVEADGSAGLLSKGRAVFSYNLPRNATETTITITNADGKQVYVGSGAKTIGGHQFTWDGEDADGNKAADGVFNIKVSGKDASGKAMEATTSSKGIVTAVTSSNGVPILHINNAEVTLDRIISISNPVVAATGTGKTS